MEAEVDATDSLETMSSAPGARKSLPVPNNVVIEICTHAHPLDVLFLARTCTTLRTILFHRSSIVAWKQAFRNAGLPLCPDDTSAPRHAALFFESVCDSCGTSRCKKSRKDVFWDMQLRLCIKCARKLVSVPSKCPGLPDGQLQTFVPTSQKTDQTRGKVYLPLLQKIMDKVQKFIGRAPTPKPAEIAAFVADAQRKFSAVETLAREAEQWDEADALAEVDREDAEMRRAMVCSRLEDEGWGDQLKSCRKHVLRHPLVNIPKKLFRDDWLLVKEKIKRDALSKSAAKNKKKALKRRKRERYRRWICAMRVLGEFQKRPGFKDSGVWPDGNDLRRMPLLQPILNGTVKARENLPSANQGEFEAKPALKSPDAATGDAPNASQPGSPSAHSITTLDDDDSDGARSDDERDNDEHGDEEGDDDDLKEDDDRDDEFPYSDDSFLPDEPADDYRSDDYPMGKDSDSEDDETGSKSSYHAEVSAAMDRVFPSALAAWRRDISLRLFDSLSKKAVRSLMGDTELTTDTAKIAFLSRAATVFECTGTEDPIQDWTTCGGTHSHSERPLYCDGPLIFYPEALEHREVCCFLNTERAEHLESRTTGPGLDGDAQTSLRVLWSPDLLGLCKPESAFVQRLVSASGLDHRTATRRDVNEVDARFVCRVCLAQPEGGDIKVHNWLSCLYDESAGLRHRSEYHAADFVRITTSAESRARELAPRTDKEGPLSVTLSSLGFSTPDGLVPS